MKPEIIEWYKGNGYNYSDFYDSKRHGGVRLSRAQVTAGIIEYYERVQSGEITPKRISIGWGVPQQAKVARFDDYVKDNEIIEKYKPIIEGLKGDIEGFKRSLLRYKVLFWVAFGAGFCLFFKMIDILGGIPL